jgi:hypothetical protein
MISCGFRDSHAMGAATQPCDSVDLPPSSTFRPVPKRTETPATTTAARPMTPLGLIRSFPALRLPAPVPGKSSNTMASANHSPEAEPIQLAATLH